MSKDAVSDWDATAANNTDIAGINIQGSGNVSQADDAMRTIMAQVGAYTRHGADLATAGTLNLDSIDTMFVNLTGATTVTAVTLTEKHSRRCRAVGAFLLTASASLVVNGSASVDYTTTAGDLLFFEGYAASVVRVWSVAAINATNVDAAGAVMNSDTSTAAMSFVVDEDDMTSDSATKVPSQQSVKAYVDDNASGITLGTPVASTSGTAIDFTGIPAGTKRITVMLKGVSTSGTSNLLFQLGDSEGIETSGYVSGSVNVGGANTGSTAGFISILVIAANNYSGAYEFTLENSSTFSWVGKGIISRNDGVPIMGSGTKSLSAELDRIRLTTVNGSDTFDLGEVNISYE